MTKNNYCIYALCDPFNEEIKYIGRSGSIKTRFKGIYKKNDTYKSNESLRKWIKELMSLGQYPKLKILVENLDYDQSVKFELIFIKKFHLQIFNIRGNPEFNKN